MKYLVSIFVAVAVASSAAFAGLEWEQTTATTNGTVTFTLPFNFLDWYKLANVQIENGTAGAWAITVATVTGGDRTNNVFQGTASTNSTGSLWLLEGDLWVKTIESATNTQIVVTSGATNFTATIQLSK